MVCSLVFLIIVEHCASGFANSASMVARILSNERLAGMLADGITELRYLICGHAFLRHLLRSEAW